MADALAGLVAGRDAEQAARALFGAGGPFESSGRREERAETAIAGVTDD